MLPSHVSHNTQSGPYHRLDPAPNSARHHPYQLQGMDLPVMPGSQDGTAMLNQDGRAFSPDSGPMTSTLSVVSSYKQVGVVCGYLTENRENAGSIQTRLENMSESQIVSSVIVAD